MDLMTIEPLGVVLLILVGFLVGFVCATATRGDDKRVIAARKRLEYLYTKLSFFLDPHDPDESWALDEVDRIRWSLEDVNK